MNALVRSSILSYVAYPGVSLWKAKQRDFYIKWQFVVIPSLTVGNQGRTNIYTYFLNSIIRQPHSLCAADRLIPRAVPLVMGWNVPISPGGRKCKSIPQPFGSQRAVRRIPWDEQCDRPRHVYSRSFASYSHTVSTVTTDFGVLNWIGTQPLIYHRRVSVFELSFATSIRMSSTPRLSLHW
jgi:hypothetical protein